MFKVTYLPGACVLALCIHTMIVLAQQPIVTESTQVMPTNNTPTPAACLPVTTKPTPETKKYVVNQCIVAQFAAYLTIGPGKFLELKNGVVDTNGSKCEDSTNQEPHLAIKYDCADLAIMIAKNGSKTFVKTIAGMHQLNGTTVPISNTSELFPATQSGHYYKCKAEQPIKVNDNEQLVISDFALEAFRTATGTDFYQIPQECAVDVQPVSDLVRIGVGVCLVALVVIVLIAYFIGRRRWSERSSYESV